MPSAPVRECVFPLLQPPLNKLFIPRPRPEWVPQVDRAFEERTGQRFDATAPFVEALCQGVGDHKEGESPQTQTVAERKAKRREEYGARLAEAIKTWSPNDNSGATRDAFRTIFVGRLSYETTEEHLRHEFEPFGPVDSIVLVKDKEGRSRGYAFIEFHHERSLKQAYLKADGIKINGRRVVVDIERGRTVRGWLPRRLGGGLGKTRAGASSVSQHVSGRDPTTHQLPAKRSPSPQARTPHSPPPAPSRERARPRYDDYEPGEYRPVERPRHDHEHRREAYPPRRRY